MFQLGAVISKKVKMIYLYSRKITDAQQRYIVTEKEILSIVETIKYFITISLGKKIRTYNAHKTLHVRIGIPIDY